MMYGSSSFDLFNELNIALTGQKGKHEMLPISWEEYIYLYRDVLAFSDIRKTEILEKLLQIFFCIYYNNI